MRAARTAGLVKLQRGIEFIDQWRLWAVRDHHLGGQKIVYINATSTRERTFALSFAREYA